MNRIVVRRIIWIVLIAAVFFVTVRGGPGNRIVSQGEAVATLTPHTVRFDDLEGYLSGGYQKKSDHGPVLVIGIDGADWREIDPLLAEVVSQGVQFTRVGR